MKSRDAVIEDVKMSVLWTADVGISHLDSPFAALVVRCKRCGMVWLLDPKSAPGAEWWRCPDLCDAKD